MLENSQDYEFCIKLALDNAKKRIDLLSSLDKKCVIEELFILSLLIRSNLK